MKLPYNFNYNLKINICNQELWMQYMHSSSSVQYFHAGIKTPTGEKIYVRSSNFSNPKKTIGISGYADGVDIKLAEGKKVKRFKDLCLHEHDLEICIEVLEAISHDKVHVNHPLAEAAIVAAITRFFKCFGSSAARGQLDHRKIYKDIPSGVAVFDYFKAVRDKHIAHDENPMTQIVAGLVINKPGSNRKVADLLALPMVARLSSQQHFEQLWLLACRARDWVGSQIEECAKQIVADYEKYSHQDLMRLPAVAMYKHGNEVVDKNRNDL